MKFEWGDNKAKSNIKKHGVSFEEVRMLWDGVHIELRANSANERRFILVGKLRGKFYSCIFTKRSGVIRIISARRSRKLEEGFYNEYVKE